ncbi:DGQHR domain-containing protein [Mycolicibacterium arenosum]|uniref:DGQHR domain-containing protein n=1 Tax=Mycolicibacterium arenosum TaxID=2952157 RepID=A0ABT1M4N5_9MYCO|nr:DGQHR domain-containing protein [Mycolicibacterium sp. CAU 1645]MCP9274071.1 DGQHR domain-containing protein [Mycolicibacterium sp. CAU 1645]
MREYLLANLSDEERAYAASLREGQTVTQDQFTRQVFSNLKDPLLSASDLAELWGPGASEQGFVDALVTLVDEGVLDTSNKTQRPFDEQGVKLFRRASGEFEYLILNAIESQSPDGVSRYQFSIEGRLIRHFARIDRLDALAGSGNQRAEIKAHVLRIRDSVLSGSHIPNSVLLVLASSATQFVDPGDEIPPDLPASFVVVRALEDFQEVALGQGDLVQRARVVELRIPWRGASFDEEKSILLVDGQQRTAAVSLISPDEIPFIDIGVSALVSTEEEAKRVFQVANETVKISTDFSKALLASMSDAPGYLKDEQVTAEIVRRLSLEDKESPLYQLVKYPNTKVDSPIIAYNSMFGVAKIFRSSLPEDIANDPAQLTPVIARAFVTVRDVWPTAWGKKPKDSRLMHGAGLRAITQVVIDKLQNYLSDGYELSGDEVWSKLEISLRRLAEKVIWAQEEFTQGTSTQKTIYIDEISKRQNTSQDISALTAFLTRTSVDLDMKAARKK